MHGLWAFRHCRARDAYCYSPAGSGARPLRFRRSRMAGAGADRLLAPGLYDAVCVGAMLVCATRVLPGGRDRLAWLFITIALLCWLGGDAYWYTVVVDLPAVPYPSLADGMYLGFDPACYVAVMLLVRGRAPDLPRVAWLDGLIGAVIAAALVVAVVFKAGARRARGQRCGGGDDDRLPGGRRPAARRRRGRTGHPRSPTGSHAGPCWPSRLPSTRSRIAFT